MVERIVADALADAGVEGEAEPALAAVPGDAPAAAELACAGYRSRAAETAMFERARAPIPGLAERLLSARTGDPLAAMVATSAELAALEPAERPDPSAAAWTSWGVPGPGGHVRHYVAAECAERLGGESSPELKRCWMYGFYVRCCEEALAEPGSGPRPAPEVR
jgi:hypothetical protein